MSEPPKQFFLDMRWNRRHGVIGDIGQRQTKHGSGISLHDLCKNGLIPFLKTLQDRRFVKKWGWDRK
jgi:hypothetical protein